MYYPTPDYLMRSFEKARSERDIVTKGEIGNINLSSIFTKIIQTVGRFCESFASDMLYDIDHVIAMTSEHDVAPGEDVIIGFGIRENGVDHNAYIMNRLEGTVSYIGYPRPETMYRKILAVRVTNVNRESTVTLRDITHSLPQFTEADRKWNPDEEVAKYKHAHPEYADEEKYNLYAVRYH